jgi:hypothetical protein
MWVVLDAYNCLSERRESGVVPDLARFLGSSPLLSEVLSQERTPFICPCIPGEDGLTLDVTGTQLVEKDIENLARGEVKSVKWDTLCLRVIGLSCRGGVIPVVMEWERHGTWGISFHFTE